MADRMTQYKFKGRDTETMRGKRRDFAVSLRKDKRKEKHDKRRDMSELREEARAFIQFDADGQAIAALRPKIENDADPATQMEALVQLRRLLAAPKELPIQATLESGVIGKLVQLLGHQNSDVQYETAWILTNISSGKPHQTAAVVEAQAIIPLCHLLSSPHGKVKDQACWCLGNIAGDGAMLRDTLIQVGALERFLQMLCEEQDLDLLRNVSWTVSNFFRWKNPPAPFEKMSMSLEVLRNCLSEDPEVLSNVCWAICYIAESGEELLDTILKTYGAYFMSLLSLPSHDAQLPAIRTLGSITAGSDSQTEGVIALGLLDVLPRLMTVEKTHVRKDACWTLSNICAGTPEQISTVLSLNLAQALVERCFDSHEVMKVKIDAAWSLCNVISQGLDAHAEYVIDNHGIPAILCVLSVEMADTRGIVVFLDALQRALTLESRAEFVKEILDEHEFEAMLIALLDHDNYEVHSRAESLAAFFNADTEIETLAPTTNEAGQFAFPQTKMSGDAAFNF